jgi:hypothetical protein
MTDVENINLHRGGRETRGGVAKVNATAISGSPRIMGLFQFRKKNGNTFIVTGTADGKIQQNYAELKTGLATNAVFTFEVFNDTLYICNGVDRPQTWDGVAASTSNLTNIPTDWSGTNFPKRIVKHGRGAAEALWAFGVASQLGAVYASGTDTDNFSDAQVTKINIETGDGFGIVGMEEFGDRLIAMGKQRPYLIDDLDASRANWGYDAAQWEGGVGNDRLLVKTPNDLIAMSEDGEIYSVITTQTVGDYRAASIVRPAHIHTWIKDNVDLSRIDDFHMIYDSVLRAIKVFVVRNGQTKVDTVLVFFIDRPPEEAWSKHRFSSVDFASASTLARVSAGNWKVYVGGHVGHVYELESTVATDDGLYYYSGFTTIANTFDNPRIRKQYDTAWLVLKPQGNEEIKSNITVDCQAITSEFFLVDELGNFVVDELGNFVVGVEQAPFTILLTGASSCLVNKNHSIGLLGTRIKQEVFNNATGERMFVAQIMYDHIPLGPEAH